MLWLIEKYVFYYIIIYFQRGRYFCNLERPVGFVHGWSGKPKLCLRAGQGGDQFQGKIPCAKSESDTNVAGNSGTLPIEDEASSAVPVLPS